MTAHFRPCPPVGRAAFPQAYRDRYRRLAAADERRCPFTLTTTCEQLRAQGHDAGGVARSVRQSSVPDLSRDRLAVTRPGAVASRLREFSPEAIHIATEGPLAIARAIVRGMRSAVHHRIPHAVSRLSGQAHAFARALVLALHRVVPPARAPGARGDRQHQRRIARSRSDAIASLDTRRRPCPVSPDAPPPPEFADLPGPSSSMSAASRSRRTSRLSSRRVSRQQGGCGRWPGAGRIAREISRGAFPRSAFGKGSCGLLCGGGRLCLPQQDGYVRAGDD